MVASPVYEPPLVLLVEEEPELRGLLGSLLIHAGFGVVGVAGGREALAQLGRRPFSAVVTSDAPRAGAGGLEFARRTRTGVFPGPVLLLSSLPGAAAPEAVDAVVAKRAAPSCLVSTLSDLLEKYSVIR